MWRWSLHRCTGEPLSRVISLILAIRALGRSLSASCLTVSNFHLPWHWLVWPINNPVGEFWYTIHHSYIAAMVVDKQRLGASIVGWCNSSSIQLQPCIFIHMNSKQLTTCSKDSWMTPRTSSKICASMSLVSCIAPFTSTLLCIPAWQVKRSCRSRMVFLFNPRMISISERLNRVFIPL